MDVTLRTPHDLFNGPIRFVVPPYQRRYVWSQEAQWEPLWADVLNLAERLAPPRGRTAKTAESVAPHFLGSIVIQPDAESTDRLPVFAIVDGQQRLFTLQLLLDAVQQACEQRELGVAGDLQRLVLNPAEYRTSNTNHDFKVWPTDEKDQEAFRHAMRNELSIKGYENERIVEAHSWFSEQGDKWLDERPSRLAQRADALREALTTLVQVVGIKLATDDDEQIIFETLNSRGTPLGTYELVKNFLQRRAREQQIESKLISNQLAHFEQAQWQRMTGSGRTRRPHTEAFLHHWLTMETGREIPLPQTFRRFQTHISKDSHNDAGKVASNLKRFSNFYKQLVITEANETEASEFRLFIRRWKTLQADVFAPVILYVWSSDASDDQAQQAYATIESYLIRRLIVGLDTRGYGAVARTLLGRLKDRGRKGVHTITREYLGQLKSDRERWPTDSDVERALIHQKLLGPVSSSRTRMILEAVELRLIDSPWRKHPHDLPGRPLSVEHIMPRHWLSVDWAPPPQQLARRNETAEQVRNRLIHSIGNLTLVHRRYNSRLRDAAWSRKCELYEEDPENLALNVDLLRFGRSDRSAVWNENTIIERSERMAKLILKIWPRRV